MSTRVQKGGTVFRPVARPRARPGSESRQASATPDAQHSVDPSGAHDDSTPSMRAASAMPPPSSVPYKPMPVAAQPLLGSFAFQPAQGDNSRSSVPVLNTILSDDQENVDYFDTGASNTTLPVRERSRPPAVQIHPPHLSGTPLRQVAPNVENITERGAAIPIVAGQSRGVLTVTTSSRSTAPSSSAGGRSASLVQSQQVHVQPHSVTHAMNSGQYGPIPIELSQIDPSLIDSSASYPQACPSDQNISQALTLDGADGPVVAGHGSWNESGPAEGSIGDTQASGSRHKRRRTQPAADVELSTATTSAGVDANVVNNAPKRKRSRRTSRDGAESEGDGSQAATRKRKPRDPNAPRKSRKRAPSVTPFEPSADPGEELDPTVITMSALCDDTGQGRISSKAAQIMTNHTAWRAANKEKRARLKAIMEAKKYGRDIEDEDQPSNRSGQDAANSGESASASTSTAPVSADAPVAGPSTAPARDSRSVNELQRRDDFNYDEDMATSRYNVQVRIGANGETIIDEESLFVNRNEEDDTENYTHVEESDTTKFVNSLSYSKKTRGSRWSAEETELFYDALSQFGENYELISYVLPGRDRKACKNKFKAEDKKDPNRINYCLNNRRPFDIAMLSRMTGKDFSGPTPIIRAPTPLRSTQLDAALQSEDESSADMVRKRSKTPGLGDDGEEILGNMDDVEKDGSVFDETEDT